MFFDVLMVIWLWRLNGRNAIANGQKPGKYQALTLVLWYGLEILGSFLGAAGIVMIDPGANPMVGAYMVGIPGAILGGYISYRLARYAPKGDYRPEPGNEAWNQQNQAYTRNADSARPAWGDGSAETLQDGREANLAKAMGSGLPPEEVLSRPATVRIIVENGGYVGGSDSFFLNGMPVCVLRPGEEHTFSTHFLHNMVTIGRPGRSPKDADYAVRFIADQGGYVEVHAAAGKLLPSMFKNFKSV